MLSCSKFSPKLKWLLAATLFMQVACLRGPSNPTSEGVTDDTTGDFRILEVTGQSVANSSNSEWQVPTEKTFEYRACLQSRVTNAQLPVGQKFHLKKFDGSGKELKTDNLGCLVWQETIPFNFSSDSFYIEKERTLVGIGTYRGSSKIRYAVNPWLEYRNEDGAEVVDLDRRSSNIPQDKLLKELAEEGAMAGLFSSRSSRNLMLELRPDMEIIKSSDIKDGKRFDIIINIRPFIQPLDMNNDRQKYNFTTGRFKVYAQLIGANLGEAHDQKSLILTPDLPPKEVSINTEGTITFKQLGIPLKRQITQGNVQLALKVVPIDPPFPMNPYEGLYNAGPFNTIFKSSWHRQIRGSQDEEGFDYAQYLKGTSNFEELKNAKWAHDLPPVEYSNLEPRFIQVREGETSTERTILYRVATQVTDGVTGSPVVKQPFLIVHPKESCEEEDTRKFATKVNKDGTCEEELTTDHRGYLYWRDALTHLYYERERRILQDFKIIQKESKREDVHTIALNPWDEGWTFGGDLRSRITEKDHVYTPTKMKPNLLMIDAFRYQTIRFRYVIDEFLTLNVKKAVVMALDPLVQRDTLYRGRIFEPLRDGVYLAKIALVKYYIDPFKNGVKLVKCEKGEDNCDESTDTYNVMNVSEGGDARKGQYTTVIKKLLRVQAGRITTPLEFSMRDLRMMSIRSNIMVQLETIDERRLLRDNLIEQKLADLEKEYFDLNPDEMTDEDKELFQKRYGYLPEELTEKQRQEIIAERSKTYEEQREFLLSFIDRANEQLNADRAHSAELQRKRFELVDRIEKDLADGNAQGEYESFENTNPLLNMPRVEVKEILTRARERIGQMEWDMKNYWSSWGDESNFSQAQKAIEHGEYVKSSSDFRRNYFDYMNVMQTFLIDHGFPPLMDEDDFDRFKINNYTQNPVAPLVDLNLYRNNSGLNRRTFIGPCTLVENDNMSEMRPTDTVDEQFCKHIDCKEVLYTPRKPLPDNREFEESKHHDSLKPFAQLHVDDIIPTHRNNERLYEMTMDATSQLGNFTHAFNLSYVSLTDQPLNEFKQGCSFEPKDNCFPETTNGVLKANSFIDKLNEFPMNELLGRFFVVNPYDNLTEIEETVKRTDSLEPLLNRSVRDSGIVFSFLRADSDQVPIMYHPMVSEKDVKKYHHEVKDEIISHKKIGLSNVSNWLKNGVKKLSLEDALRICYALSNQASTDLINNELVSNRVWEDGLTKTETHLLYKCFSKIKYLPKSKKVYLDGIHFDRRYKIIEAGSYEHIAGMNMNINVGVDFGVGSYTDVSTSTSAGINDAAILGLPAAGIGISLALMGVASAPLLVAGGAAVAATGGLIVASKTTGKSQGANISQGQSVNAATFLVVQKADFEITIKSHEKCAIFKLGREFVADLDGGQLGLTGENKMTDIPVQRALTRGYMVCDGQTTDEDEKINESYYYVTQHFTAGDMLDDVNLLNHVWLLALRGKRDFNEFIRILRSQRIDNNGKVMEDSEIYDYPLSRLGKVYKQVTPTFPGLYSVQD